MIHSAHVECPVPVTLEEHASYVSQQIRNNKDIVCNNHPEEKAAALCLEEKTFLCVDCLVEDTHSKKISMKKLLQFSNQSSPVKSPTIPTETQEASDLARLLRSKLDIEEVRRQNSDEVTTASSSCSKEASCGHAVDQKYHESFMREAIKLSTDNVVGGLGGPFGAVIVKGDQIVAKSANKVTSSNDPTAHAEVSTIRLACETLKTFDLSGCVIYTSCEPCPMCLGAIYWARLDKIYFANTKRDAAEIEFDDKFIYEEIDLPMNQRKLPFIQMMNDEALEAFKLWKDSTKKVEY